MALDDLLTLLERGINTLATPCNPVEVSTKVKPAGACTPVTPDTPRKGNEVNGHGRTGYNIERDLSIWWRFQYHDGTRKEAAYCPPATHAEALAGEPDAITVQSFKPMLRQPKEPLSEIDEILIRAWLARIEETDVEIATVLNQCRCDADARASFLHLAQPKQLPGNSY